MTDARAQEESSNADSRGRALVHADGLDRFQTMRHAPDFRRSNGVAEDGPEQFMPPGSICVHLPASA
jgi:hypothetical protein